MSRKPDTLCVDVLATPEGAAPAWEHPYYAGRAPVGIAFSGGGARSLSATMGQLRALTTLGVMDRAGALSSVSGGTWATASYVYLPAAADEIALLGPVVAPAALTLAALAAPAAGNLATVPQHLGFARIAEAVGAQLLHGVSPHEWWAGVIARCVLQPTGVWRGDHQRYFAGPTATLSAPGGILSRNPHLRAEDFHTIERPRPLLVMNGALRSRVRSSPYLPFESSPLGAGVRATFAGRGPEGQAIGGGLVEPFGIGGAWVRDVDATAAVVTTPHRGFGLHDMVAISSAAFAALLLEHVPKILKTVVDDLMPAYHYWSLADRAARWPEKLHFADGGCLEDTGIVALLARGFPRIVACVNTSEPLVRDPNGRPVIDASVQRLFGVAPAQDAPHAHFIQVFPPDAFPALATGLWEASRRGGPTVLVQDLQTVANPRWGVPSYPVRILWVYNAWAERWAAALPDEVRRVAEAERQHRFPCYATIEQLALSPTQAGLLGHLACWALLDQAETVRGLFAS